MKVNACTLALALLTAFSSNAAAQSLESYALATRALRPGDVVEVRDWNGHRVGGRVAELASCSLTVVTDDGRVELPASGTKTIKRIRRAEQSSAHRVADAGRKCENASCMAVTLAFAGTTSVARGVQKLFARPETVFRASDRSRFQAPCGERAARP